MSAQVSRSAGGSVGAGLCTDLHTPQDLGQYLGMSLFVAHLPILLHIAQVFVRYRSVQFVSVTGRQSPHVSAQPRRTFRFLEQLPYLYSLSGNRLNKNLLK